MTPENLVHKFIINRVTALHNPESFEALGTFGISRESVIALQEGAKTLSS
jgi:hypothetical protein